MTQKLKVTNLYKIFGSKPNKALADLKSGNSKDQIFSETGHVVGVMNASFTVHEGEIFVIMGLSGSGKSTLVRMLNRLIEPTSGEVVLDGIDILKQNKKDLRNLRREKISMVFQSFALMPHMTVIDNVAFGLDLAGLGREERMERSSDALEQVGLSAYENSMPRELSGGQQQRVGLARALANDPDILLMDEAFSALDPIIRTEMQDELLRLQSEHKRTIIFISHDLDEALRIGDRIAIMRDGLIVQIDTPRELANNPADDYVRNFFEKANTGHLFRAIDMIESGEKTGAQNIDENMSLPDVVKAAAAQGLPLNVINDSGAVLGHITQQNLLTNLSEQA